MAGCETAFRYQNFVVFQMQLLKRVDTLPLTREYISSHESELLALEARHPLRRGANEPLPMVDQADH